MRAFMAALEAVDPEQRVVQALSPGTRPVRCLAVGKAAAGMLAGARIALGEELVEVLSITPSDAMPSETTDPRVRHLVGEHPVPGEGSLTAGAAALDFVAGMPAGQELLVLISGGASSLMEHPADGVDAAEIVALNRRLLASGSGIAAMNLERTRLSAIKGGGLARALPAHAHGACQVLVISDVPGDDPAVVGSGPFLDPIAQEVIPHRVIAGCVDAAAAAAGALRGSGLTVELGTLSGDAGVRGEELGDWLVQAAPGTARVLHGETTVRLSEPHGRGGRCQHLALAAAMHMTGTEDVVLLAAGTDGMDGPEGPAGAVVDGGTVERGRDAGMDPEAALAGCDSGRFLEAAGELLDTGPTGTNVADLVIAIRY